MIPQLNFNVSQSAGEVTFQLRGGHLTIGLARLSSPEAVVQRFPNATLATALLRRRAKGQILNLFRSISHNRRPIGEEILPALIAAKSGVGWENQEFVFLESMPTPFQDYSQNVRGILRGEVGRLINLLRWINAQNGPAEPIGAALDFEWSEDGETWHIMPFVLESKLDVLVTLSFDQARHDRLQDYMERGLVEPVYRELYREAVELVEASPRSALVLCVAAAEIAVKTLCAEYGRAEMLAEAGAPPALVLYRDVIPTFQMANNFKGQVISPPSRLLDSLERSVSARNNLVHRGAQPLHRDSLITKMNDMRDLLLFVDYYRGHAWAYEQMLESTKSEIAEMLEQRET